MGGVQLHLVFCFLNVHGAGLGVNIVFKRQDLLFWDIHKLISWKNEIHQSEQDTIIKYLKIFQSGLAYKGCLRPDLFYALVQPHKWYGQMTKIL